MYIDFDQISPDARLWVYQANRSLTADEVRYVVNALRPALDGWAAHGQPLLASANVVENRFLLLAVDEGQALPSGCSIDASTHFVREVGQALSVDFFDRSAAYVAPDGSVQTIALPAVKANVVAGTLTPDTPVFNTLVKTKAEFLRDWRVRAADTWLKRYFRNVVA